jgi:hypothetical protein
MSGSTFQGHGRLLAGAPSAKATWHGSLKAFKFVFAELCGGAHSAFQLVQESGSDR